MMLLTAALVSGYVICLVLHASEIENDSERRPVFEIAASFLRMIGRYS